MNPQQQEPADADFWNGAVDVFPFVNDAIQKAFHGNDNEKQLGRDKITHLERIMGPNPMLMLARANPNIRATNKKMTLKKWLDMAERLMNNPQRANEANLREVARQDLQGLNGDNFTDQEKGIIRGWYNQHFPVAQAGGKRHRRKARKTRKARKGKKGTRRH